MILLIRLGKTLNVQVYRWFIINEMIFRAGLLNDENSVCVSKESVNHKTLSSSELFVHSLSAFSREECMASLLASFREGGV